MGQSNLLALVVFLLVFACIVSAIMVVRGDADTRRLESRIKSLHEVAVGPSGRRRREAAAAEHPPDRRRIAPRQRAREVRAIPPHPEGTPASPGRSSRRPASAAPARPRYVGSKVVGAAVAPALGVAAAAFFVRFLFRWEANRYQTQLFRQLPDAMGLIMRAIRAGLPMGEALANVARELASPSQEEFAQVVSNIAIGQPVDAALFGLAERSGLTEYYFFAVTVGLQAQTGGNLAETLENLADMVRKRVAMAGRVKALTAEARISAIVMSALPFVVGGVVTLIKPGHLDSMFETDLGFRLLLDRRDHARDRHHGHPRPPQERAEGLTPLMDMDASALMVAAICVLILAAAFVLLFGAKSERDILARMQGAAHGPEPDANTRQAPGSNALLNLLTKIGERLRHGALMSEKDILELERSIIAAGLNPRRAVSIFLGVKAALVVLLPPVGYVAATLYGSDYQIAVAGAGASSSG